MKELIRGFGWVNVIAAALSLIYICIYCVVYFVVLFMGGVFGTWTTFDHSQGWWRTIVDPFGPWAAFAVGLFIITALIAWAIHGILRLVWEEDLVE